MNPDPVEERDVDKLLRMLEDERVVAKLHKIVFAADIAKCTDPCCGKCYPRGPKEEGNAY